MKLGYIMIPNDILMVGSNKWLLYKIEGLGYSSWIYHCCNPMATRFTVNRFLSVVEMRNDIIKCWKCQQSPPDEIVTTWKLHNFDAIGCNHLGPELRAALSKYDMLDGNL